MDIILIGLIAAGLYILQKILYLTLWKKGLNVSLKFKDDVVRAGSHTYLTEVLENHKWLPLPALKVKFQCSGDLIFPADHNSQVTDMYYRNDLFSLMPFRRITRKHKIICSHRGYYGIRGIDLVNADLFLTKESVESRPGETWLHVLPALFEAPDLYTAVRKISGEVAYRQHLLSDPFAFRGIREYTCFDEMKSVNWKASAKSEDLKVNIYDYTALSAVSIFINLKNRDLSGMAEQIEKSISIGAYLAENYLNDGINISIYTNGRDILSNNILSAENKQDRKQVEQINKMLARLDLKREIEPFEYFEEQIKKQNGQKVIIISADWHEDMQNFLIGLNPVLVDYVWLCPCRKKSELKIKKELKPRTILIENKL